MESEGFVSVTQLKRYWLSSKSTSECVEKDLKRRGVIDVFVWFVSAGTSASEVAITGVQSLAALYPTSQSLPPHNTAYSC